VKVTSNRPTDDPSGIDLDAGVPDLIRRLTEDSKRLAGNEVRLAKLELADRMHTAGHGAMQLGIAFGAGVVALSALTIAAIAAIAMAAGGRVWIGALVIGALELIVGHALVSRGARTVGNGHYTLSANHESLKDTKAWVAAPRAD
jgi:putative superfamily III holin-X